MRGLCSRNIGWPAAALFLWDYVLSFMKNVFFAFFALHVFERFVNIGIEVSGIPEAIGFPPYSLDHIALPLPHTLPASSRFSFPCTVLYMQGWNTQAAGSRQRGPHLQQGAALKIHHLSGKEVPAPVNDERKLSIRRLCESVWQCWHQDVLLCSRFFAYDIIRKVVIAALLIADSGGSDTILCRVRVIRCWEKNHCKTTISLKYFL